MPPTRHRSNKSKMTIFWASIVLLVLGFALLTVPGSLVRAAAEPTKNGLNTIQLPTTQYSNAPSGPQVRSQFYFRHSPLNEGGSTYRSAQLNTSRTAPIPMPGAAGSRQPNGELRDSLPPHGLQFAPNSATPSPSPSPTCPPSWQIMPSPNFGPGSNGLGAIEVIFPNDIWAVGSYADGAGYTSRTLTMHWDGTQWSVVPSPNHGSDSTYLQDVSGVSSTDVWAVGGYEVSDGNSYPLSEHWDGTQWSLVTLPLPTGAAWGSVDGVAAVASDNVWAVGSYASSGYVVPFSAHWDASAWNTVFTPTPTLESESYFVGIAARNSSDIWAVGYSHYPPGTPDVVLIEHWDGSAWSIVPGANRAQADNYLQDVAVVSANDVWAVGYSTTGYYAQVTLVEHWNGSAWSIISSPNQPSSANYLYSVSAVSATDVWAVGVRSYPPNPGNPSEMIIEHWDGNAWTISPNPAIPNNGHSLGGVAVVSATNVWAVGTDSTHNSPRTLAVRWDGVQWTAVATPNSGIATNLLYSVAALSATNIWAVGYAGTSTLALHWDGSGWSRVPTPNSPVGGDMLYSVSARAPDDVWAVGTYSYYDNGDYRDHALAMHWNGTQWDLVATPGVEGVFSAFYGLEAITANDVWAVGIRDGAALTEHWDGTQWTIVSNSGGSELRAVAAGSSSDVWAVGDSYVNGVYQTLAMHWNGQVWTDVRIPVASGSRNNYLYAVSPLSSTDVWAAGLYDSISGPVYEGTLVEHWDGTQWSVMPSPNPASYSALFGLTVTTTGELWAVGTRGPWTNPEVLALHWDGSSWTDISSSEAQGGAFYSVAVLPGSNPLAVGIYPVDDYSGTLVEQYVGSGGNCATPSATPTPPTITTTPIGTPSVTAIAQSTGTAGATSTAIHTGTATASGTVVVASSTPTSVATQTSTPTATACTVSFSDVQPSDYFYQAVTYLACHGAISGYSDGTFRPYNNTTRGQLSKIVVLAEGWAINTQGGPHFSDVPQGSTFYPYVETAYNRGVISGYSDGTFRWGNNVTRGQLAKIIVLAQNWAITPPSQPTFQDVPTSHPFYGYIETAYAHGVISGYSCGTGCLEFRPGNNATRGQISKIVYNAVTGAR